MFIPMKCDRCQEAYDDKDMHGSVCAWCAADLERAEAGTPPNWDLTDADVAIIWHSRMAQEEANDGQE